MNLIFKLIITLFICFNSSAESSFSIKKFRDVSTLVKKTTKVELNKILRSFSKASRPSRIVGSSGHISARNWIISQVKNNDDQTSGVLHVEDFKPDIAFAKKLYTDDFNTEIKGKYTPDNMIYKKWDNFTKGILVQLDKRKDIIGKNIIWEKKGLIRPEELLIVGAHYDTIVYDKKNLSVQEKAQMPGADDNGTGVTLALSLIKNLSKIELPMSVLVVFFDFQEFANLGSRDFVQNSLKKWKNYKKINYINLEMLGYDSKSQDKLKKLGNMKAYIRRKGEKGHLKDLELANRLIKYGAKFTSAVQYKILANSYNSSDHFSFWESGVSAVALTHDLDNDYNEKRHHTENDFVETLNLNTLYKNYIFINSSIISMLFNLQK